MRACVRERESARTRARELECVHCGVGDEEGDGGGDGVRGVSAGACRVAGIGRGSGIAAPVAFREAVRRCVRWREFLPD